jgi:hypothetical protein
MNQVSQIYYITATQGKRWMKTIPHLLTWTIMCQGSRKLLSAWQNSLEDKPREYTIADVGNHYDKYIIVTDIGMQDSVQKKPTPPKFLKSVLAMLRF